MVLDTFMRTLPHTLRGVTVPVGTQVQVRINDPAGGTWTATATGDVWSLAEPDTQRAALIGLDSETAWRLCTRGIQPDTALARARIDGDRGGRSGLPDRVNRLLTPTDRHAEADTISTAITPSDIGGQLSPQ